MCVLTGGGGENNDHCLLLMESAGQWSGRGFPWAFVLVVSPCRTVSLVTLRADVCAWTVCVSVSVYMCVCV